MFLYRATLNRVISPVTVSCHVDLGFSVTITEPIRLNGVSMPDNPQDRAKAVAVIDDWVNRHPVFVLHTLQNKEKFGRYLGVLMDRHGGTLNKKLLEAGVVEEIPECEIPPEEEEEPEPEEEVIGEEVDEEELPPVEEVEEEAETPSDTTESEEEVEDLLEEEDEVDLQEEIEQATRRRRRWRLKSG